MLTSIRIVSQSEDELIEQCSLVLRRVGKSIYSPEYMKFTCQAGVVFAGVDECSDVVGVLVTDLWRSTDTREWNRRLLADKHLSSDPPILHLSDVAVLSEERHQSVATRLIQQAVNDSSFVDDGSLFSRCIAVSRVPHGEGTDTSLGILLRLGFVELCIVPNYYETASLWRCPDCPSHGHCRCSGHLMLWQRPE